MALSTSSLEEVIERSVLRRMAGSRAFDRGEDYVANAQVGAITERDGTLNAKVNGTQTYRVKLWREGDALDYSCNCPVGRDGAFCKHGVALGLAWLAQKTSKTSVSGKAKGLPRITLDDVRAHLLKRDKNALVDLLMRQAIGNDDLRRRLLMEVAGNAPGGLDLATYRQAIDEATNAGGYVDYHEVGAYADGINGAIDGVEKLMERGHAAEAIELFEHALMAVEQALGVVDDSNGEVGGLLERLQELHHLACKKAKVDPEALAQRLFTWELRTEWDTFFGAAQSYADVFGKKGLATYQRLAEAEWAKVPTLRHGRDDRDAYPHRFRITHIMESLAQQTGDVEALIAIKQRNLSSAYAYLQIAEAYQAAGKHDPAMSWAERGIEAFPARTDVRLREFLADIYHRCKRHDDAMGLIWALFIEIPGLHAYQRLVGHAERSGQYALWQGKALTHLRQAIVRAGQKRPVNHWSGPPPDRSILVSIFLWEKNVEAAWAEAQAGGCSSALWLELAAKREKSHPQDALEIYQKQIGPILDRTNDEAYRQAITLLRQVSKLMTRLGGPPDFVAYLSNIRQTWKRKRNFMKLLDHVHW
jgi:uncharacterized Zn finger protein